MYGLHALLLAVCAFLSAASLAWPFDSPFAHGTPVWGLHLASFATFCWVIYQGASRRIAVIYAVIYATPWLSATFWWLFVAMHTYGGLNPVLATLAVLLLATALSTYYAAAAALHWTFKDSKKPVRSALLFGLLWTGAEIARGTWLTGFGWGAIGYTQIDGPLRIAIPWVGMYGVGAIVATMAMLIAQLPKLTRLQVVLAALALAAAQVWPPIQFSASAGKISVTLLQGNIPQDQKFEAGSGVPMALDWYAQQQQVASTDLVVAPETAIPLLPQDLPDGYWEALTTRFKSGPTALMTGIPLGDFSSGYTNSVVGLSADNPEGWRYDKHHLVPFGEFIPAFFKWFTQMMNIPLGDFNRGTLGQASFQWKGQRLAANICYEDLFGEELAIRYLNEGLEPTIFVNVSNLGWFGNTPAIDQHLQISRMRALEFERPFIRATNTGATVIIDHQGRVTAALPRLTQGVLVGEVEGRTGTTPYAWWAARWGLWPIWGLIMLALALAWRAQRTSKA